MLTSSPFINLAIIIIVSYIILMINFKILKKFVIPLLFFSILLYYLGPIKLKQKLNNFSLEILCINKKVNICKLNVGDELINYQKLKKKVNNLIEKINDGNYNSPINNVHK